MNTRALAWRSPAFGSPTFRFVAAGAGAVAVSRWLRTRRRVSFAGRTVVISGGSRGLGLCVARRLVDEGAAVALLARTEADLDAAAADLRARTPGARVLTVVCDVGDRAAVDAAVAETVATLGPPAALVHCAGRIRVGPVDHMDEKDYRDLMDVHFWGAYYLTEAVRPHLPTDSTARIAYVSSVGGLVGVPHLAAYSASKHALVGYADAMRAELAERGVAVTTVAPGLMRTGSHPNAEFKGQHEKEYAWFAASDSAPGLSMGADRAARALVDALAHGDPALTLTIAAKLGAVLNAAAPGATARLTALAARLLPDATGVVGDHLQTGWDSLASPASRLSPAAPSPLTALADAAVAENNELRGHGPPG